MINSGLIYVFTGEGKGKTSAALGVATRSLLLEKKVIWIAFYKQESWGLAEAKLLKKFENLEMFFSGKGFRIANGKQLTASSKTKIAKVAGGAGVVIDTASEDEHVRAAGDGIMLAANSMQQKPFLLVMDEVLNAMSDGLLTEKEVLDLLSKRGETHVILTGRSGPSGRLPKGILDSADLVSECKKIKHPYDSGKLAVQGLDF